MIDKPLWVLNVFPTGRDLAHSLFFAASLIVVVYAIGFARGWTETATAFVIAHLSHVAADIPLRALLGYPFGTEFLFWPVLPHFTFGFSERWFEPPALVETVVTPLTDSTTFLAFEGVLFALVIVLWYADGCPGLEYLRRGSEADSQQVVN